MTFDLKYVLVGLIVGTLINGCTGHTQHSQPMSPEMVKFSHIESTSESHESVPGNPEPKSSHHLLLYNLIYIDPEASDDQIFEVVPIRESEMHLNVLKFLEDAPCTSCIKIVGFNSPQPGYLDVEIQIDHPYENLDFSAFDVRGIVMFSGNQSFPVAGKSISNPNLGGGALLNADGFTALYNGSTISAPIGDLQKYFAGNLATPNIPNSDVNGFRNFITDTPSNNRNAFFADSSDTQTYSLKLPTGPFVIGYAVDANWWTPISTPVDEPLTDFDLNANCPEPWRIVVTEEPIGEGLTDQGGLTELFIEVYDWQGKDTHYEPVLECPELFDNTIHATWQSDHSGYTRYKTTFQNIKLAPAGDYECLVKVEAKENDPGNEPWLELTTYQTVSLEVDDEGNIGGNLIWAIPAGGVSNDYSYEITTLSDDSTAVTGFFEGVSVFGKGEPNETTLTSIGSSDIYVALFNSDGTLAWARSVAGESDYGSGHDITTLSDDSTIVTGHFTDTAIFGVGESNETVLNSEGIYDIFIARYNPDGTLSWAKRAGGTAYDSGSGIISLSDDSTVVTGKFFNSAIFGPGESNEMVLTSFGDGDMFIARFDPDGSLVWVKSAGGLSGDGSTGITSLSDDSFVVTGYFRDTAYFGSGEVNETVLTSTGGWDIFIARYNPDGTIAWAVGVGGADDDIGSEVTTLSDNSIVGTGTFEGVAIFGSGEANETVLSAVGDKDIFISSFNPDGTLAWAKSAGGVSGDDHGYGITTLSDDSVVLSGWYYGLATFGQDGPFETVLTSAGADDIFIACYYSNGLLNWARSAGGSSYWYDRGYGITTLSDDSMVVTGRFSETATFGSVEPNETVLTSAGEGDIFLARFYD